MAPWPGLVDHLVEVFTPLGRIAARRLFGGWQLSANGRPFAVVLGGSLYFQADPALGEALTAAGGHPFRYMKRSGPVTVRRFMSPPEADLDDPDALLRWAGQALAG